MNPLHERNWPTASDQQINQLAMAERVVGMLQARRPPAALAMELGALVSRSRDGAAASDLDACLSLLEAEKTIAIEHHPAPDVHLEGCDLRVVALVTHDEPAEQAARSAHAAAEAVWDDWLRQFLATHRCT